MIRAVFQFIGGEDRINDQQANQFSRVVPVEQTKGIVVRSDATGRSGRYTSIKGLQEGLAHKLTPFKLEFKYDE